MTNSQKQKENKYKNKENKKNKKEGYTDLKKKTLKKKSGGGMNDVYSSNDYKDAGMFDKLKFTTDDRLSLRGDMPAFPGCSIM